VGFFGGAIRRRESRLHSSAQCPGDSPCGVGPEKAAIGAGRAAIDAAIRGLFLTIVNRARRVLKNSNDGPCIEHVEIPGLTSQDICWEVDAWLMGVIPRPRYRGRDSPDSYDIVRRCGISIQHWSAGGRWHATETGATSCHVTALENSGRVTFPIIHR